MLLAAAILIELFTSQGCSSCPPADRVLAQLDQQPVPGIEFLVLSQHVDYWNRLGWKDPYSSAALTTRQQNYGRRFALDSVYTPQVVVHGQAQLVGNDGRRIAALAAELARQPQTPLVLTHLSRSGGRLRGQVEVVIPKNVALYAALAADPAPTAVPRGENSGRQLTHVAVVRQLVRLDPSGAFDLPDSPETTRLIVFLQGPNQGPILGATRAKLSEVPLDYLQ